MITLKSSALETELNMLVRSTKMAVRDGSSSCCWGWMMKRSIDSCMLLIMKSIPLGTPTAKLYGSRCRANLSFQCMAMCEAMMRRIAEGIPIGRSLRGSLGSL